MIELFSGARGASVNSIDAISQRLKKIFQLFEELRFDNDSLVIAVVNWVWTVVPRNRPDVRQDHESLLVTCRPVGRKIAVDHLQSVGHLPKLIIHFQQESVIGFSPENVPFVPA